jgi:cytidyltransferase-related domain
MLELLDRYRHKIKSAEELRDIIGPRPRKKRVIMCHGVFDVVHPGHVRHLLYARSKADLLIASITADHHITKGTHRPHVPQDLRAVNLAAFEVVDYVVIDKNAKPIENIRIIQPDYFAKGFEYTASGMPVKTAEEATSSSPTAARSSSRPATSSIPPRISSIWRRRRSSSKSSRLSWSGTASRSTSCGKHLTP